MPTKNINAEKIQGNLDVNGLSATTFNVNNQYDLATNSPTNGDFFMYSGGSSSWNSIESPSITGTTGGTIPFVNDIGTDFDYKSGFNYDLNNLNITSTPNKGVVIDKEGGITISGNTGGVIILSGNNDTLSAATISSDNGLLINSTGTTNSVFGQEKQLYLSSSNSYVGINTTTPQATLHVKGNSNTTGTAFISNKGDLSTINTTNSSKIWIYNNHDTPNTGTSITSNVGVIIAYNTGASQYFSLPTNRGNEGEVLVRGSWSTTANESAKFSTLWYDVLLGNNLWLTGTTGGINTMRPKLPDVEIIKVGGSNTYRYNSSQGYNFTMYDNWITTINGNFGGSRTAGYKSFIRRSLFFGPATYNINTGAIQDDFTSCLSNSLLVGNTHRVNKATTVNHYFNYNDFSGNTNSKNIAIVGCQSSEINNSRNVFLAGRSASFVKGGTNIVSLGISVIQRVERDDKDYPGTLTNKYSLDMKNIIQFGNGNNTTKTYPFLDNTINFGYMKHTNLIRNAYYRKSTSNYYGRQWPNQTEGIWFGSIDVNKNSKPVLGMFKDPLLSGTTNAPLNMGSGTYTTFDCIEGVGNTPISGVNRPGSGAGILYIYGSYNGDLSSYRYGNVPTSGITNAVGLITNERYVLDSRLAPNRVSGLYIHTDANRGHWIGDALFVNPKREITGGEYNAFNLSGSSAMLDVTGSGSTTTSTIVKVKNSNNQSGIEVIDNKGSNKVDVYFNGIPSSDVGLTAGYLYKDGSGQLKIVSGASVAGNYENVIDEQFLELRLLTQTQTYSNAGTTIITDGSLVQQINDLSGKNNDATQTNNVAKFNWNISSPSINNYSYLSNIDTSRFMNLTNGLSLSASSVDDTGFCMTVVMKINTSDTFRLFDSSSTNDFLGEFSYDVPNSFCDWTNSGSTNSVTIAGSVSYTLGEWAVFSFSIGSGTVTMYSFINGVNSGSKGITTNVFRNLDRILVGGDIDVAEFTLYNNHRYVNPNNPGVDLTSEVSRLMTKYNIT